MRPSKQEFKRMRPLMGTYFQITLNGNGLQSEAELQALMSEGFETAARWESIFSRRTQKRDHPEFVALEKRALEIQEKTNGVFHVDVDKNGLVDLDGLAKGHVVDLVVDHIKKKSPEVSGVVNAGGDMGFINQETSTIHLRLGAYGNPVMRTLKIKQKAVASSSLTIAENDPHSTTNYCYKSLRPRLTPDHSAVVLSPQCVLSDALTKVGLFGSLELIEECCREFNCEILIFDAKGENTERHGKQ